MSKALSDLKELRTKRPKMPETEFISKLNKSERTAPVSQQSNQQVGSPESVSVEETPKSAISATAMNSPSVPATGQRKRANLVVAFKVPKSLNARFQNLVVRSNLPAKRVLQAIAKKFVPEFRRLTERERPTSLHTEPFSDNVPHLYHRTRIAADIENIDHIDELGLLESQKVYENWVQWEFTIFLEKYLAEFENR